ncbi:MAG: YncE family protein [Bradymonadaceae bacterium]
MLAKTSILPRVLVVFLVACEPPDPQIEERVHEVEGRCEEGAGEVSLTVEPHLHAIGPLGNAITVAEGALWIVESGANTVSRYEPGRGYEAGFVDVGNDRNPYNLFVDVPGRQIFVANYLSNSVAVADLDTGGVVHEILHGSLKNPSDVVATADHIFVANVHYISLNEGYGPGSISVFAREDFEFRGEVETTFQNPQFLEVIELAGTPHLVISSTGSLGFGSEGVEVTSEGGLEIWTLTANPLDGEREAYALNQKENPRVGAPGRLAITPDGRHAYAASAIAPALFKFDLDERRWIFDAGTPLTLYSTDRDATHALAIDEHGLLYIAAFNEDALFILDTGCDELLAGPIDLGRRGDMLEGPQSIAILSVDGGQAAYFIMSIANALGRVGINY